MTAPRASSRLVGWIGWAGLEAIGRLALLTGSTIVFSRLLAPRDFGVTALVLTIVATAAIFVGSPFEEALTQRRYLRGAHVRAALSVSWLIGAVLVGLSILGGSALSRLYGADEIAVLLPVAMASVFFSGHSDIVTALARRRRRFNDVAIATLAGHAVGIAASLALAFAGYGLWALIGQRLLVVTARAIILQWRIGHLVTPSLSLAPARDLGRFSRYSFLARLTENVAYLAFNNLVQAFYGVAALGQVNMAMRLIEPIRGAITATSHNLAFSFLTRANRDAAHFAALAQTIASQAAFVSTPIFVGMAAVAPTLLPMVAGPGWEDAIPIAVCLSLAAALAVPSGLIYTALSANGRPEFSLYSLVGGFVAIVLVLVGCSALGPISLGLSRLAGDAVRAGVALGVSPAHLGWSRRGRLQALWPAWVLAALMGAMVFLADGALPARGPAPHLAFMIAIGVIAYATLVSLFAKAMFQTLKAHLAQASAPLMRKFAR